MFIKHRVLIFGSALALGIFLAWFALHLSHDGSAREIPRAKPSEWFVAQRAYPGTEIPHGAYLEALSRARELRAETAIAGGGLWEQAGPSNIGGRITALAVHPSAPNVIYAGAADGGVVKTVDGGASWTPLTDYLGSLSVGALAIHPGDPQTVFLGTGEANAAGDSYEGIGILKSDDGGADWVLVGLEDSRHIGRIVIDPIHPDTIWVAACGALFGKNAERGVYRSTDGGMSWERKLFISDSTACIDLVINPDKPDTVWAAMWERIRNPEDRRVGGVTSGIWRTHDGGENWTRLAGGLPAPASDVGRIGLAVCASQPDVLYAIYADDPGYFDGVYKTTDGGDNWSRVNDGTLSDLYSSYGWYFGNIRVDPSDPDRVYAMGLDMYRSQNGGNFWAKITFGVHVDQHDLWINSTDTDHMVLGNDGGVYETHSGQWPWTKFVDLPVTQFYAGAIDYQLPDRLYGGTQDNGTLRTLSGAVDDWEMIYDGDGFYCLVDPTDSDVIYAEYQYGGLGKSDDGGDTFHDATSGIDGYDRRNWSTPVVMDPSDHLTLYYGTYRLYRTVNGAGSWNTVSGDLTDGPGGGSLVYGTITTIAVAPTNPDVMYVGTDDANVWVTQNGGDDWSPINTGLPQRWVTRVAVDPSNESICYVTLSGYKEGSYLPHVFRSENYGFDWTDISSNLPPGPVNAIVVDPADTGILYVGTDFSVYLSVSAGASWSALGENLPLSAVHDLKLHHPTRSLVAMTHGRSMFRFGLDQLSEVAEREPRSELPRDLVLRSFPNPFVEKTSLAFRLEEPATVSLKVYDVRGRLVRQLLQKRLPAGDHAAIWDGRNDDGRAVASGTYYARLEAGGLVALGEIGLVH